jgi:hypothetical protein
MARAEPHTFETVIKACRRSHGRHLGGRRGASASAGITMAMGLTSAETGV